MCLLFVLSDFICKAGEGSVHSRTRPAHTDGHTDDREMKRSRVTIRRTRLCRCEVRHESVAMASNRNAAEEKEGSRSVEPAQYNTRS
ncbi:hypothetical protein EVAR_97173_1 [Eumeta japonica]|uniref:Uncharacterized protein n=1 Tax=Eumeta variegata TaxID=151549 RepID=A0A4C1XQS9_EUMVA|nr:hypothetical protein EVAR_97173_1 [Eumeta japonica]